MNPTKWARLGAVILVLGSTAACDTDLTEINRNPNNPESVPLSTVLGSGIWSLASNSAGRGMFGEWTGLFHTYTWSQYTAQSTYNDEDHYTPREGIPQEIWTEAYSGPLLDLKRTQELALAANDKNLAAVADILQVNGFLFLTDLYGDIPYFEALDLKNHPTPAFTPQAQIYPDLLKRLAADAAAITPSSTPGWASGDLMYDGNLERWQEFANSLRLRIAMRVSSTSLAASARTDFAAAWAANRFDDNSDNADVDWSGTLPAQNPMFENIVLGGRDGDFRVAKSIIDALQSRNDPRLPFYAERAVSDGKYRGLPNGLLPEEVGEGTTLDDYSNIGPAFLSPSTPSVFLSYAETLFLGAEAAAKGWIAGDPAALYRQGIQASMRVFDIPQAEIDAYLARPSVAYAGVNSIYLQKWIALYLNGPESFAELRRTGQPALPLSENAVIDQFPSRLPYPPEEGLYNPNFAAYENVEYTDKLFWMP